MVVDSEVPHTVLRATQFHQFVRDLLDSVARLPVWPLPTTWQSQPIEVTEVADRVVDHATTDPQGRLPDVGGPEVHTLGDLARSYRRARGLRRPVIRLPVPGATARAFREGVATCPDRAVGSVTWEDFLDRAVANPESAADGHAAEVGT